ncbi:hypothetical protein [Chitinophaga silvisoli]|uniref:Uncharacterized protein n=1 Tax=Chitinophaga silvisoli TaxID=2291814 RepID=A0A3E1P2V9_9BACT|nr:hypothetical protein [Chitinophaga silvisoli]RFM34460.1 hypothetical protein DXN04_14380 [Chitinophaga silvisoli]
MKLISFIPIAFVLLPCLVSAQDSIKNQIRYIRYVEQSTGTYEKKISLYSQKVLRKFSREELKIKNKLVKLDPQKAKELFASDVQSYSNAVKSKVYSKIPFSGHLDTAQLSLQFLKKNGFADQYMDQARKNQEALQGKLKVTEDIQAYIQSRKRQLQEQLVQYTQFSKNLQSLSKQAYYYKEQLAEYKSTYESPSKIERKALSELKKLPAYNEFVKNNSIVGSLFNLGEDYNNTRSLEGLQVRTQVEEIVQTRVGTDPNARAAISQQLEQAKDKLSELKNKYPELNSAAEMPDFKPNPMKTKPFLKRLEFGGNIQFQKNSSYYPTITDIAGQVGYKFNKNGSIGIGISYKLGLGSGWNHIAFSHQGIGIRSYIDHKIKGSFYITGGYEKNYFQSFSRFTELYHLHHWTESALLGISKKYRINAKLKGNLQILYDFIPQNKSLSNHIKVRIGYNF